MKTVVAALIEKDGKYLIAQRKAGSALGGLWEFPGGKVEAGESDTEALEREILEEFNTVVTVGKLPATAPIDEGTTLKLYACKHYLGGYHAKDHDEVGWVSNLATLRVLGFYRPEVTMHIVRENIVFTFMAIIVGYGIGHVLTYFILSAAASDQLTFPHIITWQGYVIATSVTVVFTAIVGVATHIKLRNTDMIAALKSDD